jgi:TonB family protein
VEIRLYAPNHQGEMAEFIQQGRRDREAFAPPPPKQRDQEPFLPGVGDVTMPVHISHTNPVYPDAARPEKMDGQVIVEVTVDHEGNATLPHILTSSSPIFEPPAMASAKTYKYKPATRNGQPVTVTMDLVMVFKFTARQSP